MPEENIHLDDYGDGAKPKNSRRKFFAALLLIILVIGAAFTAVRWHEFQQDQRGIEELASRLRQAEKDKIFKSFNQVTSSYSGEAISSVVQAATTSVSSSLPKDKASSPTTSGSPSPAIPIKSSVILSPVSAVSQATSLEVQQTDLLPPEQSINPESLAGIVCYFNTTLTNPENGTTASGGKYALRGSGVIIDAQGHILTNRHIVAPADSFEVVKDSNGNPLQITVSFQLDRCEVGQVPAGTHLPTPDEIRSVNPFFQLPVLGFTAMPEYISSTDVSDNEIQLADFAILRITGLTQSGPTFGVTSVPSSFPYATLLPVKQYLKVGNFVITYGFPGDITQAQNNAFETLTIMGSVGNVTGIEFGEKYYADVPLTIYTKLEIASGRSGSPLFWRGYVIGLITFYTGGNRNDSGSVASDAILKALQSWGLKIE